VKRHFSLYEFETTAIGRAKHRETYREQDRSAPEATFREQHQRKISYSIVAETTIALVELQAQGGQHVTLRPNLGGSTRKVEAWCNIAVLHELIRYCDAVPGEA